MGDGVIRIVSEGPDVFDEGLALSSVGGDVEFLCEIAGLTRAALPTLLDNIREGLAERDLQAVGLAAHLAAAAARNVSARRAYEAALQLEMAAYAEDLRRAQGAHAQLEREIEQLHLALSMLRNSRCRSCRWISISHS